MKVSRCHEAKTVEKPIKIGDGRYWFHYCSECKKLCEVIDLPDEKEESNER